ncbi:acyl-phosphate glycerol 3-phosphate acyltransferase [Ureibacillus thermophilus]|uniref:Acyl-phosphate glycerol 3-phosphate acyltransferase n=1 Tax=Ureibacillus thermophilus TaxID=367743 RepID=A0A4P6USN6_9BACL|nr:acyl-phosphate glycerol 3-phosphate acyltransferase [Ureibacillus thermophilus]QBK26143.1 acyl-phosphate glycerol 3-phosphate acyltransferase [Ureibacillus thermophilus]
MNQPKINPGLLRLFVIFPNILAWCLMIGIIFFVVTNFEELKAADALTFWVILLVVFIPITLTTSYSIIKRIKNGTL